MFTKKPASASFPGPTMRRPFMHALMPGLTFRLALVFVFVGMGMPLASQAQPTSVTFSANGPFVVPSGVTSIIVEAWGGGGGGAIDGKDRAGGGGGSYARSTLIVSPGTSYVVVIGTGGSPGTNGGTSSFGNNLVVAPGGNSGSGTAGGNGGSGGTGEFTYIGGNGASAPGGGGSSAGHSADGNNASGRVGGTAPAGGGDGGSIPEGNNSVGQPGIVPGGGGAGKSGPGEGGSSGSGARGQVIVTYTLGQTYSLSGRVLDTNGDPVSGVTIESSGGHTNAVVTAPDGTYELPAIPSAATNITITPSLAGYSFDPASRLVEGPVSGNIGDLDFTATLISQTHSVSGYITYQSDPLPGVAITASGDHGQTVFSDATGAYTLSGIPHGADFSITPSVTGYDFVPPVIQLSNLTGNLAGQDFVAYATGDRIISGTILDESGHPVEGVIVTASGDYNQTVLTNGVGAYQITGMGTGGQTIAITPSLTNYGFSPTDRTVDFHHVSNYQVPGQDFTAIFASGTFYSRQTGNYNQADTWSRTGHTGSAAGRAPEAGDEVYIGSNHVVTLTQDVTTSSFIIVYDGGTLVSGQHVISGSGSFSLANSGVIQIGAPGGISQSGPTGNIQTSSRNFHSEASYIYNGSAAQATGTALPQTIARLTINNPSGVTAETSHRVTALLNLSDGVLTMPVGGSMAASQVTSSNGKLRMQTEFSSGKGWRMITSPVQTTYADLFDGGFVTQGFPGSGFPENQPNVLWFDETDIGTTNEAWRTIGTLGEDTHGGRGYFFYVFNGDGGYSDHLPLVMDAVGLEHTDASGGFDFGPSYTPRTAGVSGNSEIMELNAGWNLTGNPSAASIDWDAPGGWTKSNMDNTIYIWSPTAGNFVTWNGITGSGTTKIAPFQAFWVLATGSNPVLQMNAGAKGLEGSFAQKSPAEALSDRRTTIPILQMELYSDTLFASSYLSFMEEGQFGEDPFDAYRLEPLSDTFLKLYTTSSMHNKPLVINNLPEELNETIQIPLYVGGQYGETPVTGPSTLNWTASGEWPSDWSVTLMDHQLQTATSMTNNNTYAFQLSGGTKSQGPTPAKAGSTSRTSGKPLAGTNKSGDRSRTTEGQKSHEPFFLPTNIIAAHDPLAKASTQTPRFTIVIKPDSEGDEEPEYLSNEARLMPNFPNPFGYQTTIRFSLPEAGHVTIGVYDIQGRRVAQLADNHFESGTTTLPWTPNRLPAGIYFAVMKTTDKVETQKLILIR